MKKITLVINYISLVLILSILGYAASLGDKQGEIRVTQKIQKEAK